MKMFLTLAWEMGATHFVGCLSAFLSPVLDSHLCPLSHSILSRLKEALKEGKKGGRRLCFLCDDYHEAKSSVA